MVEVLDVLKGIEGAKSWEFRRVVLTLHSPISDDSTPNIKQGRNSVRSWRSICLPWMCSKYIQLSNVNLHSLSELFSEKIGFILDIDQKCPNIVGLFSLKSLIFVRSIPPFFEVIHNLQLPLSQKKCQQIPEIWSRIEDGPGMQFKRVLQKI